MASITMRNLELYTTNDRWEVRYIGQSSIQPSDLLVTVCRRLNKLVFIAQKVDLHVLVTMCIFSEYNVCQTFQLIHKDAQLAGVVSNLYWVYMVGQIEPLNQAREFSTNRGAIYVFKVSWFTGVFDLCTVVQHICRPVFSNII